MYLVERSELPFKPRQGDKRTWSTWASVFDLYNGNNSHMVSTTKMIRIPENSSKLAKEKKKKKALVTDGSSLSVEQGQEAQQW